MCSSSIQREENKGKKKNEGIALLAGNGQWVHGVFRARWPKSFVLKHPLSSFFDVRMEMALALLVFLFMGDAFFVFFGV